jgi:hypothetical protein
MLLGAMTAPPSELLADYAATKKSGDTAAALEGMAAAMVEVEGLRLP